MSRSKPVLWIVAVNSICLVRSILLRVTDPRAYASGIAPAALNYYIRTAFVAARIEAA